MQLLIGRVNVYFNRYCTFWGTYGPSRRDPHLSIHTPLFLTLVTRNTSR